MSSPRDSRRLEGKALRLVVPRSTHSLWQAASDRPSIVDMLNASNRDRLPELIPLRHSRMLKSPLACFRGLASVMANDLAKRQNTGILLQSCGDCHLQNFGWFATPERNLIFDITDFDETLAAPWEWDLKRLVVSVVLAARGLAASQVRQQELGHSVVQSYREHLTKYETLSPLHMWYERIDAASLLKNAADTRSRERLQAVINKAHDRTIDRLLPTLTRQIKGNWSIVDQPPLIFHPSDRNRYFQDIQHLIGQYHLTLSDDRRVLLDRYRLVDAAYKVVGVGSVGLRCGIALFLDAGNTPLVLQVKEARESVLEAAMGGEPLTQSGKRVVSGQRLMQAASDMFLGWARDDEGRDYYVRQLRDMKMSVNTETLMLNELEEYGRFCGWALARAHAKVGDASSILGYIGAGDQFAVALSTFALSYTNEVERDFDTLKRAARSGEISVAD